MAAETQRLTDLERANLVAYLDGELNEPEARALSTKLTQSVTGRREVDALQKAWELLDFLPRPEPSEALITRTLTEIRTLESRGGKAGQVANRAATIAVRVLTCTATAAATLAVGYALTRWAWPDPTARLVRDLSVAEHVDEYREVGSFEFLKLLDSSPEFNKDVK